MNLRIKNTVIAVVLLLGLTIIGCQQKDQIDRFSLVSRNSVKISSFDTLNSVSVGNGEFAFTIDPTGLQSFPTLYKKGMPLGTMSQWGWHSFPDTENYQFGETLKPYNFRDKEELYATQFKEHGRQRDAANYFRVNPHRLHLGYVGFEFLGNDNTPLSHKEITDINQTLDMWSGMAISNYKVQGDSVVVKTACDPKRDLISSTIKSALIAKKKVSVTLKFGYPTGSHSDDATRWDVNDKHESLILTIDSSSALIMRVLDSDVYYVRVKWEGDALLSERSRNCFTLSPSSDNFNFSVEFLKTADPVVNQTVNATIENANAYWKQFWEEGAAVDFSKCKDERAKELERRVILSQYLTAIQCSGTTPPAETGLTYNSWYGKFHLEMHWWHAAHFALWNRTELLSRSFDWYKNTAFDNAKAIAERQGFAGVRWMKMTDPSANEAPSKVGSFLIWQQPHFIYMAELAYRSQPQEALLKEYQEQVFATADFMADFATYDSIRNQYILKGIIPAQETLRASVTVNPPFELSYWHFALKVAQQWRERLGMSRNEKWDDVINKLAPLASKDGLYLAAETAPQTYSDIRFTSDHMAVLGALGILPASPLVKTDTMQTTLNWVWDNWNWEETWGWDYPMTAMCAARLGDADKAIGMLLDNKRTNTYLSNGHNFQDKRLRVYLPGNGGLLTAVAMMCAGWDGCDTPNPGFPKDGNWDVRWEGLHPLP